MTTRSFGQQSENIEITKSDPICRGNSIIRNPILISYVAKGLLPYHGLGSGIKRALEQWLQIDFTDDREGCLFTAAVRRVAKVEIQRQPPTQSPTQSGDPVERLIRVLRGGEFSTAELRGGERGGTWFQMQLYRTQGPDTLEGGRPCFYWRGFAILIGCKGRG